MLRNISVIVFFMIASFLFFGAQSHSSAQLAISNSQAGYGAVPLLFCSVNGGPKATGGFSGTCQIGGMTWTLNGAISNIVNTTDDRGNYFSLITASGAYYPIVNGVKGTPTVSKVTFLMSKMANGTCYEGVWISNLFTGAFVYATGMNRDGSVYQVPMVGGTMTITL